MSQEFEVIEVQVTEVQNAVQGEVAAVAVQSCISSAATYTASEIASKLAVSIRSVYSYANKLIEIWSWLPEGEFRHDGRYTVKALNEMMRLKASKSVNDYALTVAEESGNYTPKAGQLAQIETQSTVQTLTAKPLPNFAKVEYKSVDTSAIRSRTKKLGEINSQLGEAITQLVAKKVENKIEELDVRLDDFFAEIEAYSKHQAVKRLQENQG